MHHDDQSAHVHDGACDCGSDHHHHHHGDGQHVQLYLAPATREAEGPDAFEAILREATIAWSGEAIHLHPGETIPLRTLVALHLPDGDAANRYRLPTEVGEAVAILSDIPAAAIPLAVAHPDADGCFHAHPPLATRAFRHQHRHDEEISSVGFEIPGALDLDRLNAWMARLLLAQGPDIFRMKGVLAIDGVDERYIFQGVHMLHSGSFGEPWDGETPHNRLVFIGRNLDREVLEAGFRACIAA